jgi:glycosyltransferase involved in cell wall biosynthesis
MSEVKVSIGLPVYNGENYLELAIDTILKQTNSDFELIISDNCSNDATAEICQAACHRDARVRYIRQNRNIGAIGNFNSLIHLARGCYFKWAAHDDVMDAEYIESLVQVLDNNSQIDWVYANSDMIDAEGRSFKQILPPQYEGFELDAQQQPRWAGHPRKNADSDSAAARFRGVILGINWCVDSYGLFRLKALKRTRTLLPVYGAEKILIAELALNGKSAWVPELLFYQRVHANASGNLASEEAQREFSGNNTNTSGAGFVSTRLYILWAHFSAVNRTRLPLLEKLRAYQAVAEYILQVRKWRKILQSWRSGSGVGGAIRQQLNAARKHSKKQH